MGIVIFIGKSGRWVIVDWPAPNEGNQRMLIGLRELEDSDDIRYTEHAPGFYSASAVWEATEGVNRFDYVTLNNVAPLYQANVDSLLVKLSRGQLVGRQEEV